MRTSRSETILQGFRGKSRSYVHPGDSGKHASDPEPDTLSHVPVCQLCTYTWSREVPGTAGAAILARRSWSGFISTGNGHPGFSSWQRQVLGYSPRDLCHEPFVRSLLFLSVVFRDTRGILTPDWKFLPGGTSFLYIPKFGIPLVGLLYHGSLLDHGGSCGNTLCRPFWLSSYKNYFILLKAEEKCLLDLSYVRFSSWSINQVDCSRNFAREWKFYVYDNISLIRIQYVILGKTIGTFNATMCEIMAHRFFFVYSHFISFRCTHKRAVCMYAQF